MKSVYFLNTLSAPADSPGTYRAEILRCGEWDYPEAGAGDGFSISPQDIRELAENFNARIKGDAVPLNFDHGDGSDCGWVTKLAVSNDGQSLHALMDVTDPEVRKKVGEGTLRYVSCELDLAYKSPEKTSPHYNQERKVLAGLALTNTPYVKGMAPIAPIALCEKPPTVSTASAAKETHMSDTNPEVLALHERVRSLEAELAQKNDAAKFRPLLLSGKITPAVLKRLNRLSQILTAPGVDRVIKLSAPIKVLKLAEGCAPGEEEEVDKVDLMDEITDMMQQLPASVSMANAQPDPMDSSGLLDGDEDDALLAKTDQIKAANPALSEREAQRQARVALKGGRR